MANKSSNQKKRPVNKQLNDRIDNPENLPDDLFEMLRVLKYAQDHEYSLAPKWADHLIPVIEELIDMKIEFGETELNSEFDTSENEVYTELEKNLTHPGELVSLDLAFRVQELDDSVFDSLDSAIEYMAAHLSDGSPAAWTITKVNVIRRNAL